MTRIIKFRGLKNDNTFCYGSLLSDNIIICKTESDYIYVEVDPNTVSQFIGIYDKTGKEIYENDIVQSDKKFYSTNIAQVKWMDKRCSFYFIANCVGTDVICRDPFQSAFKINSLKVEVIGNIYQNGDLLK